MWLFDAYGLKASVGTDTEIFPFLYLVTCKKETHGHIPI